MYFCRDSKGFLHFTPCPDHRDFVWDGVRFIASHEYKFDSPQNSTLPSRLIPYTPSWIDTEIAWLFGFFLSSGYVSFRPFFVKRPYQVVFTSNQRSFQQNYERACVALQQIGAPMWSLCLRNVDGCTRLLCTDTYIGRLFMESFYINQEKCVPKMLLNASKEVTLACLEAIPSKQIVVDNPTFKFGLLYLLQHVAQLETVSCREIENDETEDQTKQVAIVISWK